MASGVVHARANRAVIATSIPSMIALAQRGVGDPVFWVPFLLGEAVAYYLTPDIDQPGRTLEELRWLERTPVLGKLWVMFWASYGQGFDHRGVSHVALLGTATRAVWLVRHLIFLVVGVGVLSLTGHVEVVRWPFASFLAAVPPAAWGGFFAGWAFIDCGHLFLDGMLIPKRLKPRFPRLGNSRKRSSRVPAFRPLFVEM